MNFGSGAGEFGILSAIIFAPLLGAVLLYLIPVFSEKFDPDGNRARTFALVLSLGVFVLSLFPLVAFFQAGFPADMQSVERISWIPTFGISYLIGVDGISLLLVVLTTLLVPIVILSSTSVHDRVRLYLANMLVLECAMIGTLLSLDLFLFYVFWELMLAPMYFIIGIWGGKRRIYATLKFVLYTVVGSVLMLIAILYAVWQHYEQTGMLTTALDTLLTHTQFSLKEEFWLFGACALAFGIKVPVFPFHTWLPDAHVEAPTGGSVILAGVLLKMGLYGFVRFAYPLFPRGAEMFTPLIIALAVIGIVYGALVAWAQTDMKKLVAYSSVSHLGYCVLGFFAYDLLSFSGSMYQMLNHGVSTGALFLLVGVLYERKHTREISEYGGLTKRMPLFAFLFLVFTLSSIALPLTNGFVGEFLILCGSFMKFPVATVLASTGVVIGAIYMLTLYLKTMFGELDQARNGDITDVNARELCTFVPLLILVFYMGIFPNQLLKSIEPALKAHQKVVAARIDSLGKADSVRAAVQQGEVVQPAAHEPRIVEGESYAKS